VDWPQDCKELRRMTLQNAKVRQAAALQTSSDPCSNSAKLTFAALTEGLSDMFALYLQKAKHFHWHVSGPHP
jgi:DNA-binding ferritin-like protein